MEHLAFARPVSILVGLGFPRHVSSVMEAYTVLTEWHSSGARPEHAAAIAACKGALAGSCGADTAREAFLAFAARNHLLASLPAAEVVAAKARIAAPI